MSKDQQNISTMKVNEFIQMVVPMFSSCRPCDTPPIMLWGPPGIGKSDAMKAIAKLVEKNTGKKVIVTDVRLLLFNPIDLRGIPSKVDSIIPGQFDAEGNPKIEAVAKWLKPQIFQMDESKDVINLLLLDELSAAAPSVQAAAYQITLDRIIGEHKLPDNTFVLAAGNRVTDKSVAFNMPKALANRLTHLEIEAELEDWKQWAIPKGISVEIIAFLNNNPSELFKFDPSNDHLAFATPRSWEKVDFYIKQMNSIEAAFPMIAGQIGSGSAMAFKTYAQVFTRIPDIKAIFDGTVKDYPKTADVLYALSASIVAHTKKIAEESAKNSDKKSKEKAMLTNMLKYVTGMKEEFSILTMRDVIRIQVVQQELIKIPEWVSWASKFGDYII